MFIVSNCCTICYAQHDLPPIYEIKSDTAFEQDLGNNYWQMLEDKEGKWTIDQITRPPFSNQFRNDESEKKAITALPKIDDLVYERRISPTNQSTKITGSQQAITVSQR